jgi:hypothetical protein
MPKWKIILPVLIVVIVGLVAYMQMTSQEQVAPAEPMADEPAVTEEVEITGEEPVDVQVDALVDSLIMEADLEEGAAGDGSDVASDLNQGSDESVLFTVESYE